MLPNLWGNAGSMLTSGLEHSPATTFMDISKSLQPLLLSSSDFDFTLHPVRPLLHFGQRLTVGLSTAVSFDPDTVLKAASGRSLTYFHKQMDYASYLALQAWVRSMTQGSVMQRSTRASLAKVMTPVDDINRPPTLEELTSLPNALTGYWRALFRTFRRGTGPTWRGILVRLAARDRQLHALNHMGAEDQVVMRAKLFLPSLHYWRSTALFGKSFRPMLVLDATLEHLAWADVRLSRCGQAALRIDPIVGLVRPEKVPMRHWFDRILELTGTPNLVVLCDLLAERADTASPRIFTHLELKQWATGSKRLAPGPAYQLLAACQPEVDMHRERVQLWTASLLTFLVSFVQAFATEAVTQSVAQAAIYERLAALRSLILATNVKDKT